MLYPDELRAHHLIGRGREIRTPDILVPNQARYQTALYPVPLCPRGQSTDDTQGIKEGQEKIDVIVGVEGKFSPTHFSAINPQRSLCPITLKKLGRFSKRAGVFLT